MTTVYNVNKNFQGVNGYGTPFCDQTFTATIAAATATALPVPGTSAMGMAPATKSANTFLAVFTYAPSAKVWVANNHTAAIPAGAAFAASNSVLNPPAKIVKTGDILSFICTAGADVCVEFYSTQSN